MATNGKNMEDMIAASEERKAFAETTGTSSRSASTLSGYVLINNTSAARSEKISDQDLELIVRGRDDARGRAAALESEREILMARIAALLSLLSPKKMAIYTSIYPEEESVQRIVPTRSIPGLQYQPVPGDGHCLFNAVALHLGEDQSFLRRLVAAHIEFNMAHYRSIIKVLNPKKTPEEYLRDLRQGIEWADNLEITVLMKMLNRPIVIIGLDGSIRNLLDLVGEGDPIFVQYNGHNHYDALVLTGEKTSREIFKAMTQLIGHSPKGRSDNSNSTSAHSITASCSDPSGLTSSASAAAAYVPPISHAFDSAAAYSFPRSAAHPSSTPYASSSAPLTFGTSSASMSLASGSFSSLIAPPNDQSPEDAANFAALDAAEFARRGSIAQSEASSERSQLEVGQPHRSGLNEEEHNDRTSVVSAPPSIVANTISTQSVNNAEVLERGRLEAENRHQTEARATQLQIASLRQEVERLQRARAAQVQRSEQLAAKINTMQPKLAEFQRLETQRKAQEAKRIAEARKKAMALKAKALADEKAEITKIAKTLLIRKGDLGLPVLMGMEPSKAVAVLTACKGLFSVHQAAIAAENARTEAAYSSVRWGKCAPSRGK